MTVISSLVPIVLSLCAMWLPGWKWWLLQCAVIKNSHDTHMCMLWSRDAHFLIRAFSPKMHAMRSLLWKIMPAHTQKILIHRRRAIFLVSFDAGVRQFGVSVCTENNAVLCRAVADFFLVHKANLCNASRSIPGNKVNFWWKILLSKLEDECYECFWEALVLNQLGEEGE